MPVVVPADVLGGTASGSSSNETMQPASELRAMLRR
jgi:hypothetical protein